jgi:transcriptional regulator with XRE-family HTH domain
VTLLASHMLTGRKRHHPAARIDRKLTQAELAKRIGVNESQVQFYEKGRNMPPAERLARIVRALYCEVLDLFVEVGSPTRFQRRRAAALAARRPATGSHVELAGPVTAPIGHKLNKSARNYSMILTERPFWPM